MYILYIGEKVVKWKVPTPGPMRIAKYHDALLSQRRRPAPMNQGLARWGVGILPVRCRERDAPATAGRMPALRT